MDELSKLEAKLLQLNAQTNSNRVPAEKELEDRSAKGYSQHGQSEVEKMDKGHITVEEAYLRMFGEYKPKQAKRYYVNYAGDGRPQPKSSSSSQVVAEAEIQPSPKAHKEQELLNSTNPIQVEPKIRIIPDTPEVSQSQIELREANSSDNLFTEIDTVVRPSTAPPMTAKSKTRVRMLTRTMTRIIVSSSETLEGSPDPGPSEETTDSQLHKVAQAIKSEENKNDSISKSSSRSSTPSRPASKKSVVFKDKLVEDSPEILDTSGESSPRSKSPSDRSISSNKSSLKKESKSPMDICVGMSPLIKTEIHVAVEATETEKTHITEDKLPPPPKKKFVSRIPIPKFRLTPPTSPTSSSTAQASNLRPTPNPKTQARKPPKPKTAPTRKQPEAKSYAKMRASKIIVSKKPTPPPSISSSMSTDTSSVVSESPEVSQERLAEIAAGLVCDIEKSTEVDENLERPVPSDTSTSTCSEKSEEVEDDNRNESEELEDDSQNEPGESATIVFKSENESQINSATCTAATEELTLTPEKALKEESKANIDHENESTNAKVISPNSPKPSVSNTASVINHNHQTHTHSHAKTTVSQVSALSSATKSKSTCGRDDGSGYEVKAKKSGIIPCRYNTAGCMEELPRGTLTEEEHYRECRYRPIPCLFHRICNEIVPYHNFIFHNNAHYLAPNYTKNLLTHVTIQTEDFLYNQTWTPKWLSCYDHHFYLMLTHTRGKAIGAGVWICWVYIFGMQTEAVDYFYEVEIFKGGKRLLGTFTVQSVHTGMEQVEKSKSGLVFTDAMAKNISAMGKNVWGDFFVDVNIGKKSKSDKRKPSYAGPYRVDENNE